MRVLLSSIVVALVAVLSAAVLAGPRLVLEVTSRETVGEHLVAIEGSLSLDGMNGIRAVEVKARIPSGAGESLTLVSQAELPGALVLPTRRVGDPACQVFAVVFPNDEGSAASGTRLMLGHMQCRASRDAAPMVTARGVMMDGSRVEIPLSYRWGPALGRTPGLTLAPNPSLGGVDVRYRVMNPSQVVVTAFDLRGRLVRTVFAGMQEAGEQLMRWDGRDDRGDAVPLGVYFLKLRIGTEVHTDRVVLVR